MTSFPRRIIPVSFSALAASAGFIVAMLLLALTGYIVARACGYDIGALVRYAVYLALYVVLPGAVVMQLLNRGPMALATLLALAVPTGFAVEIFTFLGSSALGLKPLYAWVPLGWAVLAGGLFYFRGDWPLRLDVSRWNGARWAGLALAVLGMAIMASSQMFSESPLAAGLPTRAIFHDWVYLVSRAGAIKHHWPLNDPSLSDTPLQYHFFLMAHAAAASWTTGVETGAVLLRLVYVPLGVVMVAQAYVLGRDVSRSCWGGVVAALLTVLVSELSVSSSYAAPMFLGIFGRWLFVSPTFFFGLIYCGALLIAVPQCLRLSRCGWIHYLWVFGLAVAGTGAKGTVLPVLVCAMGLWAVWGGVKDRRFPWRHVALGVCLLAGFAVVYILTLSTWKTGNAAFRPFHAFEVTQFWRDYPRSWTSLLSHWLPLQLSGWIVSAVCAAIVFAGTCGVRLLALPYLISNDAKHRDPLLAGWLGAFFAASVGMGTLLELNSHGELYLILMMRLPTAVLAAGFLVMAGNRISEWRRQRQAAVVSWAIRPAPQLRSRMVAGWSRLLSGGAAILVCAVSLGIQLSTSWNRNHAGFRVFLATPIDIKPDDYMQHLQHALLWVRENTESNAVLVTNTCTPENMLKDHWGALDRTLTGVHFYYSALSERRLWFEGPSYILDAPRASQRASLASDFFYRGGALPSALVSAGPSYALIDLSLADGASVALPIEQRIFSNSRVQVYRLLAAAD